MNANRSLWPNAGSFPGVLCRRQNRLQQVAAPAGALPMLPQGPSTFTFSSWWVGRLKTSFFASASTHPCILNRPSEKKLQSDKLKDTTTCTLDDRNVVCTKSQAGVGSVIAQEWL